MPVLVDSIARNLRRPETGLVASFVLRFLKTKNSFIEEKAVELAKIHSQHDVLEIGFGPGIGLKRAARCIKKGEGRVHGIDISPAMMVEAMKHLKQEIADDIVELTLGNAAQLPYRDDSMDRIFHNNCYYFWPDKTAVARELFRVLKPGGLMVSLLHLQRIRRMQGVGFLKYGDPDPESYINALRTAGFECNGVETRTDGDKTYESILAQKL